MKDEVNPLKPISLSDSNDIIWIRNQIKRLDLKEARLLSKRESGAINWAEYMESLQFIEEDRSYYVSILSKISKR